MGFAFACNGAHLGLHQAAVLCLLLFHGLTGSLQVRDGCSLKACTSRDSNTGEQRKHVSLIICRHLIVPAHISRRYRDRDRFADMQQERFGRTAEEGPPLLEGAL
jgi:hypothetical protein